MGTTLKLLLCFLFIFFNTNTPCGHSDTTFPGLPPIKESEAFADFLKGPRNAFHKLLFLIDRFKDADAKIIYDGFEFHTSMAANVAKWFLYTNYKDQTPKEWIYQWCNRSIPGDELIWVELPNGERRLSRDILLNELETLEQAVRGI